MKIHFQKLLEIRRIRLLLSILIMIGFFIITAAVLFVRSHHQKADSHGYVYSAHLDPKGLTLNSSYAPIKSGDLNKNGKLDAGEFVSLSFTILNDNKQAARMVTLDTGIPTSFSGYVQNLKGTTGIDTSGKSLVIKNILILPHQQQEITFDMQTMFSAKDYSLELAPSIIDPSNNVVARAEAKSININRSDNANHTQVMVTKGE